MYLSSPVAKAAVRSKVVVLLLLIFCLMYFPLFLGVLCLCLFCYVLHCVHFSFAIILKWKRKLVALLLLSYRCIVTINVMWLCLTALWVGLQCVIVVFPDHTHLLLNTDSIDFEVLGCALSATGSLVLFLIILNKGPIRGLFS